MATKYEKINFDEVENETVEESVEEVVTTEDVEVLEESNKKVNTLTSKDKAKLKETMKAMTDEEQIVSLKVVSSEKLWNELRRRNAMMQDKIENFNNIMGVSLNTINPIPEYSWIGMVDRYSDVEVRFNEIMKVMGV